MQPRNTGITAKGNFLDHSHPQPLKEQNILSIIKPDEKLDDAAKATLAGIKKKLFDVRVKRIRPHLDDKILVSWNGLMLGSMARAGLLFNKPSYLESAKKNIGFVKGKLSIRSPKRFSIVIAMASATLRSCSPLILSTCMGSLNITK